jgi:predicted MPP superfamily phosphohydrolase
MLTKEEIKIGNYFIYSRRGVSLRKQWAENDWYRLSECIVDIEDFIPIRISQNILNDFGFKKQLTIGGYDYWYAGVDEMWSIRKNENSNWQMCIVTGLNTVFCFEPILQYVHQLQNLYHSLTDKQLIYKK